MNVLWELLCNWHTPENLERIDAFVELVELEVSWKSVKCICSFLCKLWARILILVDFNKIFSKKILYPFWSRVFEWQMFC